MVRIIRGDQIRLRIREILECPNCSIDITQCDECGDFARINQDWYCNLDEDKHYCQQCYLPFL